MTTVEEFAAQQRRGNSVIEVSIYRRPALAGAARRNADSQPQLELYVSDHKNELCAMLLAPSLAEAIDTLATIGRRASTVTVLVHNHDKTGAYRQVVTELRKRLPLAQSRPSVVRAVRMTPLPVDTNRRHRQGVRA